MSITAANPTTVATEVQHQPWCNNHLEGGACSKEWALGDGSTFVNVEDDGSGAYVTVWGNGDPLIQQDARRMASALIRAADVVEEEQAGAVDVEALWAGTVADVQKVAAERGVTVSAVVRRMERTQDSA